MVLIAAALADGEWQRGNVRSAVTREELRALSNKDTLSWWLFHSSGIECCEVEPEVLRSNMIVVFEPELDFEYQGH
jgi:hypothetical protein